MEQIEKDYYLLLNSKISLDESGNLVSINGKEELENVKRILSDATFFENVLRYYQDLNIVLVWLPYADKEIFNNKEIIKLLALRLPDSLKYVPDHLLSDIDLINDIALIKGIDFDRVSPYIPYEYIDHFADMWTLTNKMEISKELIDNIKKINTTPKRVSFKIRDFKTEYDIIKSKYEILVNSRIRIENGVMVSDNGEEELKQVEEILQDAEFFATALTTFDPKYIRGWLSYLSDELYTNKRLIKAVIKTSPSYLYRVPKYMFEDDEFLNEISNIENIRYVDIIHNIPSNKIELFTNMCIENQGLEIAESDLIEILESAKEKESSRR